MSMHLVRGMTSLNTGKSKKKLSVKQQRAKAEHEAWLKKQGIHPDQLSTRKKIAKEDNIVIEKSANANIPSNGHGFAPIVAKRSVFDSAWHRDYEDDPLMAEREALALQQAEEKKKRIMPLYNKGPLQYASEGTNLKEGNGRGRR